METRKSQIFGIILTKVADDDLVKVADLCDDYIKEIEELKFFLKEARDYAKDKRKF